MKNNALYIYIDKLESQRTELLEVAKEAALQIRYLQEKFDETGSGDAVIARLEAVIAKTERRET